MSRHPLCRMTALWIVICFCICVAVTPAAAQDTETPKEPAEAASPESEVLPVTAPVTVSPAQDAVCPGLGQGITLCCETENAVIYYATSDDGENFTEFAPYTAELPLSPGFGMLWVQAYAQGAEMEPSEKVTRVFRELEYPEGNLYFGQLHCHTAVSDGTGTPEQAFTYASEVAGLDFLAVTDHSQSFDNAQQGSLHQDGTAISSDWAAGQQAAMDATDDDFVALYGFEMTWNNGLGHIGTFCTPGWATRDQDSFLQMSTGLENYYAALGSIPGAFGQFHHPGTAFGDFDGFGHYTREADLVMTLMEVMNGDVNGEPETFFDAYTRALDQGWHLAPTASENNHAGNWGDSGCCTVVLATELTPEAICDALRNYRVYATGDRDLRLYYTLDGYPMGTVLMPEQVGATVTVTLQFSDATDSGASIVAVITAGGEMLAEQTAEDAAVFTLDSGYPYYYIRVFQPDGDMAVTAPVWIDQNKTAGIRDFRAESDTVVAGAPADFLLELYNDSTAALEITSLTVVDGATGETVFARDDGFTLSGDGVTIPFSHTFADDGCYTLRATVQASRNGNSLTFTRELSLAVRPKNITADILIDATHGNPGLDQLKQLTDMASAAGLVLHVETAAITEEMLSGCDLLILSAPTAPLEEEFLSLTAGFIRNGGNILLCGTEGGNEELNRLLTFLGATMTLETDTVRDDFVNCGTPEQLSLTDIRPDTPWTKGISIAAQVAEGELHQAFLVENACGVDPGSGSWLVRGYETTESAGGMSPVLLAWEQVNGGDLFLAGGLFLTDAMVGQIPGNSWELPSANRTVLENILDITRTAPAVTDIGVVRGAAETGGVFLIEGYITAGTANPYTVMADTLYLQNATGGIAIHGYAGPTVPIGTHMQIVGNVALRNGDIGMETVSFRILDGQTQSVLPQRLSLREAGNDTFYGGQLVEVEGTVISVVPTADGRGAAEFILQDTQGSRIRVMAEEGVYSSITGENTLFRFVRPGAEVSAVGLVFSLDGETVIRIRDCEEVICRKAAPEAGSPATGDAMVWVLMLMCGSGCGLILLGKNRW